MNNTATQDLGTEKVSKLLMRYALPAIIAMTASSLYNMVDSIFIGQGVGAMAISGLAVTFPLTNLSAAFGTLVGMGGAALTSILLGQKNYPVVQKVLGNVVVLNCIIATLFAVLSLIFLDPILYFFGASEQTIGYARDYMVVILIGNLITHLYFGLNAMLRATGHPKQAMAATILTVTLNSILDPLFIFVFDMGIQGAAIATVLAQVVSLVWLLKIFSNKSAQVHFELRSLKLDGRIAKESLSIGMAPFLMNTAACMVVIFINQQLKTYGGDFAIGAYGIVNRLVFFIVMVILGLNQGMQPIAGYNYGAKLYGRLVEVLRSTILAATCVSCFGFVMGMFFPEMLVSAFTSDEQMIAMASRGLRIVVAVFPIVGLQIVTSNFFQSIGLARRAIVLSLSRQLLFLLPGLAILPMFYGTDGVWYSMPLSDLLATILAAVLLVKLLKKFKNVEA